MTKAVLFDIDGVLLNSFEANLKFFQDLMIHAGYPPPTREEFPPMFHLSMMDAIKALTKSSNAEEIKNIWEIGRSREVPYDVELLSMPEGTKEVLEELSKEFALGIVTSRQQNSVYEAPRLAKLQAYFQVAVCYEDTIHHKPDPEPLLFAAEKLAVKPNECIYIADVENDIKAARAAGMKIIIYSKNQFSEADICVSSFKDLSKAIKTL